MRHDFIETNYLRFCLRPNRRSTAAESAERSRLIFSPPFIAVHQATVTYRDQRRPRRDDGVTNYGHLPRIKVCRETNLITIAPPRCLSIFLVRGFLLFERRSGEAPSWIVSMCNASFAARLFCLPCCCLAVTPGNDAQLLLSASAVFY